MFNTTPISLLSRASDRPRARCTLRGIYTAKYAQPIKMRTNAPAPATSSPLSASHSSHIALERIITKKTHSLSRAPRSPRAARTSLDDVARAISALLTRTRSRF